MRASLLNLTILAGLLTSVGVAKNLPGKRVPASDETAVPAAADTVSPELDRLQTEVKKMQVHFNNVSANSTRERLLKGGVFIAGSGFLLGAYIAQDRLGTGEPRVVAKGVVGATGVLFGIAGLATWLFPEPAEESADRFRTIAGKNERQMKDKLLLGEGELRKYAERAKLNRRIIGGGFLTVGLADLIWYWGTGNNTSLNFLPYLGGLYGVLGGLMLTFESAAEMEYQNFLSEKEVTRDSVKLSFYPTFNPTYAAPGVGMALRF